MMKLKNLLLALVISITVIHCSKDYTKPKNYKANINKLGVDDNKFQYIIEENNHYVFHDYETDNIIYTVDSLFFCNIEIDGQTLFIYDDEDDGAHIYNSELELIEKLDGSVCGSTDSSLVIFKYLMGPKPEFNWEYNPRKIEGISLSTYPKKNEIIVEELYADTRIGDKYYYRALDTLGTMSYYDDDLIKLKDFEAGEFIENGRIHNLTQIDSVTLQYDDFIIDYSDCKYEGLILMNKLYGELYLLSLFKNEVILTDHNFNIIEKTEIIKNAKYKIFSIKENIEIGFKILEQVDWFLPGRNDSIYAQVEVCDSVFYEQYWFDSDTLSYRIVNAENHYDSNVRTELIDGLADSYVDNPERPLFLVEDDGFLFLNNALNVIFESEDELELYALKQDSMLMLLREKYTNKKYLKLYNWKD